MSAPLLPRIRQWLASLSFRSGVICAVCAALFYAVSFGQMLLPISATAKGGLWVLFFGLAKTAQYSALLIRGKEGVKRMKRLFLRRSE